MGIQKQDLRIGNWIFDAGDEQKNFQIEQICKDSDGFSGYYVVFRNGSFKSSISSDLIQPIVLTPEILEKCGFKTPEMYQDTVKFKDGVMLDLHRGKILLRDNDRIELMYLHQLQNLYFALTGEELEVKL